MLIVPICRQYCNRSTFSIIKTINGLNMNKKNKIEPRLLNKSAIARESGYSRSYVSLLLRGKRTNKKALNTVQKTISKLYGNIYHKSKAA